MIVSSYSRIPSSSIFLRSALGIHGAVVLVVRAGVPKVHRRGGVICDCQQSNEVSGYVRKPCSCLAKLIWAMFLYCDRHGWRVSEKVALVREAYQLAARSGCHQQRHFRLKLNSMLLMAYATFFRHPSARRRARISFAREEAAIQTCVVLEGKLVEIMEAAVTLDLF
jgi:hypothetical protein